MAMSTVSGYVERNARHDQVTRAVAALMRDRMLVPLIRRRQRTVVHDDSGRLTARAR